MSTEAALPITRLLNRIEIAEAHGKPINGPLLADIHAALTSYRDKAIPLGFELAKLLDAAEPLLTAAAARERRAEAGKALRCITHQSRAKVAQEAVKRSQGVFGYRMD